MTRFAKGPGERMDFIRQVQGHPAATAEDVATAAILATFVHSKEGTTFVRFDTLARVLRVSRRTLMWRLARLKERGHISITRRGQAPPEIAAILLPDCVPEVQSPRTSEPYPEVQRNRTSENLSESPEVQPRGVLRCNDDFVSHSKQTVPEPLNTGRTRELHKKAGEGDIPKPENSGSPADGAKATEQAPSGAQPQSPLQPVSHGGEGAASAGSLAPEAHSPAIPAPPANERQRRKRINYVELLKKLDAEGYGLSKN
ncbi:hypothetical protein LMG27198_29420 [Methylocystis echinoides]|uniref:Helix-turn-helix domain-containing protein n=1 Tax=Methylocystis echinoides TaxID=29468 RepID=A0A9W6LSQ7_9HYPH|nr:hypothetical protein LMG27198_29420 [Methylocystis echinoides]